MTHKLFGVARLETNAAYKIRALITVYWGEELS